MVKYKLFFRAVPFIKQLLYASRVVSRIFLTILMFDPCMVAIFCQFSKSSHFSNISCFYDPFYAQNSSNVPVEPLLTCFSQFCLTQSDQFCHSSKSSYFFNISCFSKPFYPYRTSNVLVEPFLACFSQFYCDPNWPFFAKASLCIGAIFRRLVSFFEY